LEGLSKLDEKNAHLVDEMKRENYRTSLPKKKRIQHPPITCYNENKTLRFEKHTVIPKAQNIKLGRTERK
jgi:hypothetical protein